MQQASSRAQLIQAKSDFFRLNGQNLGADFSLPGVLPSSLSETLDDETRAQNHPRVRAAHQKAQAARQQVHAVDQDRKADPTIALSGGQEEAEGLVKLTFSIPLQFRNDFRSNVDAAQSDAVQIEQQALQVYRDQLAQLQGAQARYQSVIAAWSLWESEGKLSLKKRISLLEALWKAGEMGTTDYLFQVKQTLDTQIAGVELHGNLWSAWVEWLSASGTLNQWLDTSATEQ